MNLTVRKKSTSNLLLYLLIIISFLSYEYRIYNSFYKYMIITVFALGGIIFLNKITKRKVFTEYFITLKRNVLVHLLSISLVFSTLMTSTKNGLVTINSLISIVVTILSFYIFYLYIPLFFTEKLEKKIDIVVLLITFFSIIGIIIGINGNFLGYYPTHYPRVASIFFDPNYFGTLAALGFILSIHKKGKHRIIPLINLVALYFSGSRGAMVSLIFVIVVFYFYKKKPNYKTILAFLTLGILTYYFVGFLADNNFFRTYQGLSSRDYLWKLSLDLISKEPLWGYGYGAVGDVMRSNGALNGSSHNSYLDYIMMYGIPTFMLYSIIIVKAVYLGVKNNIPNYIIKSVLLLLINANTIFINLGGLGATSLLFTLFLGVCNSSGKGNRLCMHYNSRMYSNFRKKDGPKIDKNIIRKK